MWNMIFGTDPVNTFEIKDASVRVADQKDSSVEQSMLLTEDLGLEIEFNSLEKRDEFISDLTCKLEGSPIKAVTQSPNRAAVLLDVVNDQAETQEGRLATATHFLTKHYGFDFGLALANNAARKQEVEEQAKIWEQFSPAITPGLDAKKKGANDGNEASEELESRRTCRIS